MRLKTDAVSTCRLRLDGLEVRCIIGDLPRERTVRQKIAVGVELEIDGAVCSSDDIADTVDYAALADLIRERLVAARCRMIERAAALVADACLEQPAVRSVTASVTKTGAVRGLASATAICSASRKS